MKHSSGSKSSPRASELSYSEKGSKGKEIEEPIEEKPIDEKPPPDYALDGAKEDTVTHIEHAETNEEEPPLKPLRRRRRAYNHLKRRWYFYAAGIVVFLAIFLPILFLVIVPALAQRIINVAALPIHWVHILDPKADTVGVSFQASLKVPIGLTVKMDPFTMSLYDQNDDGKSVTYLNANLPDYKLHGNANLTVPYQVDPVLDKPMFSKFMSDVVNNAKFTLKAKSLGKVTAHFGKLKAKVNMKKDITLTGLEKFKGLGITSGQLALPPEDDGVNFIGNLSVPNQSILTADMGNVTLNALSGDLVIGNVTMYHVYLSPGANAIKFRGTLDFMTILQNLKAVYAVQASYLKQGQILLGVTGTATIYNGVHITYIEEVMNALRLDVPTALKPIVQQSLQGFKSNISGVGTYIFSSFESWIKTLDLSALKGNGTNLNTT
ncbi:uncharacterized protein BDZ99DRAFT_451056 [Mytilinidion resinicola]|uniref:Uncharacterized protein n=1 Tax=Mytilinidion resinicola TaxID=574789 RepID=A0A6A6Y957_9PEZI|nr:uncharacterized protein BDZ99DRAFT_451056 [Mytilinidion resinicola]KAF2805361.1 hypothetical protein BDZ99DRAFT_451056 [Mytilinidion resinicola]